MSITLLLADDYELFREGLKSLLQSVPLYRVVGTAGDGVEAVRLARELEPDVVLLDVSMPLLNGREATKKILALKNRTRVIALTAHDDADLAAELIAAGASGYLLKNCSFQEICQAIQTVAGGGTALDRTLRDLPLAQFGQKESGRPVAAINLREREVLQLLVEGKKTSEIAEVLHLSVKTVETHRKNIMVKLNVKGVAQLTRVALREKFSLP